MNPRDQYPALAVAGLALVIAFILVGAIAIGVVSLSDFTDASDPSTGNNTTFITPESPDYLPPGYQPNGISVAKAGAVHLEELEGRAYTYKYRYNPGKDASTVVLLNVSPNGSTVGTKKTYGSVTGDQTYNIRSESGVKYVVTYPNNETVMREFADTEYNTGLDLIRRVVNHGEIVMQDYESTEDGYLYFYAFEDEETNTTGVLVVTDDGLVRRAYLQTMVDTHRVSFEMTIRSTDPHGDSSGGSSSG